MSASPGAIDLIQYQGSCHCGSVQLAVQLPALTKVFACNCSICARNAYLWAFPAVKHHLVISKGEDDLKTYEFGNRTRIHKFCHICGTSVMAAMHQAPEGRAIAINVRTFKEIDLDALEILPFDGQALKPSYEAPKASTELATKEGLEVYSGSCHCGAITYSVRSKPLVKDGPKAAHCGCSICSRNGYLWIYPRKADVMVQGEGALTDYVFGQFSTHKFCSSCGVSLFNEPQNTEIDMFPVNARTLNGIDLKELNIEKGYQPPIIYIEAET